MPAKQGSARRRPDRAYFECFALLLAPATGAQQGARVRRLAAALGRGWSVRRVGAPVAAAKRAEREFFLTPPDGTQPSEREAWDRAAELARVRGVRSVEPLFAAPGLEPSPRHLRTLLMPKELRARRPRGAKAASTGGGKPKPCAARPDWSLDAIRAEKAWAIAPPSGKPFGEGIVIGHLDTGYTDHPELRDAAPAPARVLVPRGYDFESRDPDARDPLRGSAPGHGTSTASVIMSALRGPEPAFVSGVAPRASLIPVRVSGGVIHLSFANVIDGIHHCIRQGVHVISMSLGGPIPSSALARAVDHAVDAGVIVLAAAGNVWPDVVYPARLPRVIAVAATNCESRPWSRSARGEEVDVAAPGESVWRASAKRKGGKPAFGVAPSSGTSYAVANVAGACALWLAFHGRDALVARYGAPKLSRVFAHVLTRTCNAPSGWNAKRHGAGIVDAERLLLEPLPAAAAVAARAARRTPRTAAATRTRVLVAGRSTSPAARVAEAELAFRAATSPRWRAALAQARTRPAALTALAEAEASTALAERIRPGSRPRGVRRGRTRRRR